MVAMSSPPGRVWRPDHLPGTELLHARQQTHAFPKHSHDGYAFGVIEQGALGFFYRGEQVVAATGDISLCVPGEPHTGHPAADSWSYRMFYLETRVLERVHEDVTETPGALPFFRAGVLNDPDTARRLWGLHRQYETHSKTQQETSCESQHPTPHEIPGAVRLEHQSALLLTLAQLIRRHADAPVAQRRIGQEPSAVRQVRDYLYQHYARDVSLDDLARLSQLSRYYLVRVFRAHVGVPPHAYLRQVRVERAKALLAAGDDIAAVALATGFSDQSHLTRWFKRLWGYTPGHYRNSLQDGGGPVSLR